MKRFACILLPGIFFCLNFGCQSPNAKAIAGVHGSMELVVEPGEHWLGKMKVFILSIQKTPQMAAWIEDENGQYVATITVTNRSARQNWRSAPEEGRPEALPVWSHRQQNNEKHDDLALQPSAKREGSPLDAVSAATQKGTVEARIGTDVLINGKIYNVYLEINHSFDYNDHWIKDNSGVNGQPSLVYHAQFIAGQPGRISLVPAGHGSVDGSDGNITSGLENFTSALSIVKSAYIE